MEKKETPRRFRRRNRLEELLGEYGGAAQVARESGTPKSHFSALLAAKRGLGDELAAKLETLYDKPEGWFDSESATAELTLPSFSIKGSGGPSSPEHKTSLEEALATLAAMLEQADPDTLNTVSALLAGFGKNPASHAKVARALQVILTPDEKYDKDRDAPPYDGQALQMAG